MDKKCDAIMIFRQNKKENCQAEIAAAKRDSKGPMGLMCTEYNHYKQIAFLYIIIMG